MPSEVGWFNAPFVTAQRGENFIAALEAKNKLRAGDTRLPEIKAAEILLRDLPENPPSPNVAYMPVYYKKGPDGEMHLSALPLYTSGRPPKKIGEIPIEGVAISTGKIVPNRTTGELNLEVTFSGITGYAPMRYFPVAKKQPNRVSAGDIAFAEKWYSIARFRPKNMRMLPALDMKIHFGANTNPAQRFAYVLGGSERSKRGRQVEKIPLKEGMEVITTGLDFFGGVNGLGKKEVPVQRVGILVDGRFAYVNREVLRIPYNAKQSGDKKENWEKQMDQVSKINPDKQVFEDAPTTNDLSPKRQKEDKLASL